MCVILIDGMMEYIVLIVALFQGQVTDEPEQMVETKYLPGGDVEHEVWVFICGSITDIW